MNNIFVSDIDTHGIVSQKYAQYEKIFLFYFQSIEYFSHNLGQAFELLWN